MKYNLGLDYVCILKENLYQFLLFVKLNHISLYSLSFDHEFCYCYIPVYYRFHLKKYQYNYRIIKTIGFISYVFILLKKFQRIIFILSFLFFIFIYSQLIFKVNINGFDHKLNTQLNQYIQTHGVNIYHKMLDYEHLNDLLLNIKDEYKDVIEYINIYKVGSSFHIDYIKRNNIREVEDNFKQIYASKNGIIYKIDVSEGNVLVKINDYVNKGDLLVDNNIITTNNKTEIIPVDGKIFAYTFETYSATCQNREDASGDLFYKLLFEIRKQLPLNAYIDKENVLQMEVKHSKITLTMQYTLIEDISMQGENNEGNH